MPKKRTSRIYWRERGGVRRAYADFRDYADVGGRQEALVPPGAKQATTDPDTAEALVADRLRQLAERRAAGVLGVRASPALAAYAVEHLRAKAREGQVTTGWLERSQRFLERAVEFFGASKPLGAITPKDCSAWAAWLQSEVASHRRTASGAALPASRGTVRHHLNVLSDLYRRAISEGVVGLEGNPVAGMYRKPVGEKHDAEYLQMHEAALLLEAAREYVPPRRGNASPAFYEFLATLLLTGARSKEVRNLRVEDVSFDRQTVRIRVHDATPGQRLKTAGASRTVPLWPQLAEILGPYICPPDRTPRTGLLFPAGPRGAGADASIGDVRKQLLAVARLVGLEGRFDAFNKERVFRHTYMTARLQTTENGKPVSRYTVMAEGGWKSLAMIEEVYGHLGDVRHRSPVVEYRLEAHRAAVLRYAALQPAPVRASIEAMVGASGSVTRNVTAPP